MTLLNDSSRVVGNGDGLFHADDDVEAMGTASMESGMNGSSINDSMMMKETEMTGIQPVQDNSDQDSERLGSINLNDNNNDPFQKMDNHVHNDNNDDDNGVGESLPTPEEIRATVNPRPANTSKAAFSGKGNGMLCCFFVSLVVILALSIGLGVGLSDSEETRHSSPQSIQTYAVTRGMSSAEDFEDLNSPQSKAAHWMAFADRLNLGTPDPSLDLDSNKAAYHFALRYAMTVVYYSTGGEEHWLFRYNFLTSMETCRWNGSRRSLTTGLVYPFGVICDDEDKAYAILLDGQNAIGTLPDEIGAIDTLIEVNFNYNQYLAGTIPSGICMLTQLQYLSVGNTQLGGSIPPCINQLDQLIVMFLSNNQLDGSLPPMSDMVSLQRIYLDDNRLTGNITNAFDSLLQLKYLSLENNQLTGIVGDAFLRQNSQLRTIDISGNPMQGQLPLHLFELTDLLLVDMHGTFVGGQFPSVLFQNPSVIFLAFSDCNIEGPIPTTINKLPNLLHLDLSGNKMSGELPSQLGDLVRLEYLLLSDNENLTPGEIPDTFSNLTALQELSLRGTKRYGPLPDFISTWTNLTLLDLSQNSFEGNLPSSYSDLINLEFLILDGNDDLKGTVPESYQTLTNLRAVFLEGNSFTGDLAHMCAMSTFNEPSGDIDGSEILVADCAGGLVTCTCCVCCGVNSDVDAQKICNNHNLSTSLSLEWEKDYERTEYNFGNQTRFIDKDYIS
ncbi:hypothetical protein ACA910_005995 [Epithemia clementina (nom. ined.)]